VMEVTGRNGGPNHTGNCMEPEGVFPRTFW